jgi:hypothetical protein
MVSHVLEIAETWVAWMARRPSVVDRVYTPQKGHRRVTDHMIDHLAQLEAHLVDISSLPAGRINRGRVEHHRSPEAPVR